MINGIIARMVRNNTSNRNKPIGQPQQRWQSTAKKSEWRKTVGLFFCYCIRKESSSNKRLMNKSVAAILLPTIRQQWVQILCWGCNCVGCYAHERKHMIRFCDELFLYVATVLKNNSFVRTIMLRPSSRDLEQRVWRNGVGRNKFRINRFISYFSKGWI